MLKWFSGEEGEPGGTAPGSPPAATPAAETVTEIAERLAQTEQLVFQLKELIREKDATLRTKDEQLKSEKEACEAKLSKMRLQNKAKVTSLSSQLEELKKQNGDVASPKKKGASDTGEHASRGKIVLLKKKIEELESQLKLGEEDLQTMRKELEDQRQRGEDMDAMLTERDKKLSEKEAYIVHLQTALAGDSATATHVPVEVTTVQDLQLLVQSLTRKVGEADERYSLMLEQNNSLKELLDSEKQQYSQKENMYKENIQTFKDIIQQKDNQLSEINQIHEQELFKLAAKLDASADLEQLLKALKQKLHEEEEVLQGKNQVIDVLQGEVDGRDQQIKELSERVRRLHVERESLESKMEAEKHVMRAQVRDLMERHIVEVQQISEQHQTQTNEIEQGLLRKIEELRGASLAAAPSACLETSCTDDSRTDGAVMQKISELEAQTKQKSEEASRSEAKFLKMKAWSKSRIRQLEEELKKSQAGVAPPDLTALRSRITALEEEREEHLWKIEQYDELRQQNEMLTAKLVVYEDQQRTLQAELEQFTKRATSQASESGSADDTQSHVLEWQEMVSEAVSARDQAQEEKATMALRISHMEEEREALATRQQELEEELAEARGVDQHRAKKRLVPAQRSLQEDFEFDGQFQDHRSPSESTAPMEGENMGGGLRSVVEELEVERNQLQEQIVSLEERCQDLEDRLQLQARIEQLQSESEKLQSQLASVRSQQSRDAENHQLLVSNLNQQLKGLSSTQECLESSLIEKENTLAKTSEKLQVIDTLQETLSDKEHQYKEVSERLLYSENQLEEVSKKHSVAQKQCSEFKKEIDDLTQKLSVHKEKTQKQEVTIEALQTELDQTTEELDKLNSSHLEERAQLIHELQNCEREMDSLRDILVEKDNEISILSGNMVEFGEQVTELKQELKVKEENLVQLEKALSKAELEANVLKGSQSSDQESLNEKIADLLGKLKDSETELLTVKEENESKMAEVKIVLKQSEEDKKAIQVAKAETQKHITGHQIHLTECETLVASIKQQLHNSQQELEESNVNHGRELQDKEQIFEKELKSFKDEQNKLLVDIEKCNNEINSLSKLLQEREQSEENVKKEIIEKTEAMLSLESKFRESDEEQKKLTAAIEVKEGDNQKLNEKLQSMSEKHVKLKNEFVDIKAEKEKLQETIHNLSEVVEQQNQDIANLNEKLSSALEMNNHLEEKIQQITKEGDLLQKEVEQKIDFIQNLEKEKEAFASKAKDLTKVLEESSNSNSESLLAKTNECSQLSHVLKEKEETVTHLQEEVKRLLSEVDQLQKDIEDKQHIGSDSQMQISVLQDSLNQLKGKESILEDSLSEMRDALKQTRQERETLQEEVVRQKNSLCEHELQLESLGKENSQLCLEFKEREENLAKQDLIHKHQLDEANQILKSKSEHVTKLEGDIKKMELEAELKQTEQTSQETKICAVEEENQQLSERCNSTLKELEQHKHLMSNVEKQLKEVQEQNSRLSLKITELTENDQKLQDELTQKMQSISKLTADIGVLQETKAALEMNISDKEKKMNGLLNEKEELSAVSNELKRILQESELSVSADLQEKINVCSSLSATLQEKEEQVKCLEKEVETLKVQVNQLNISARENEKMLSERSSQLEAQQNEMLQVQDNMSMLQEQGSVLKSGLLEKEKLLQEKVEECSVYQREASQQKEQIVLLQKELEAVGVEVSELKLQLARKDQQFLSQKSELEKREETIIALSAQLGTMNVKCAKMEEEATHLKAEEQNISVCLKDLEEKRKMDVNDLEENIQALNEQNKRLKSELQKTITDLTVERSKVEQLTTSLNGQKIELEMAFSEKEQLHTNLQEKGASLKEQEEKIQQLVNQISDQEELLKNQKAEITNLEESVSTLRNQVQMLISESSELKSNLEIKEQSSQESHNNSLTVVENLNLHLHDKEKECESLKEQMAHLEESVAKINITLQIQSSECENLRNALEDKESCLSKQQESLKDLEKRAEEAYLFKDQFIESTELVSQLQSQIQHQSSETENHKRCSEEIQSAFSNIQDKYVAALDELQNLKTELSQKSDEMSILKKQFDESCSQYQQTTQSLQTQCSSLHLELEKAQENNHCLTKEKDKAFASHQANVSQLTVEIEKLKLQLLQVAEKMNVLTENLEQREMALHVINSQYTNQAKHTSQLVSEIEKTETQNKILTEELALLRQENEKNVSAITKENAHLQEKLAQLVLEKEELERRHSEILESQRTLKTQVEKQSSSLTEVLSEKTSLQAEVSAKNDDISRLKKTVDNVEHILQDSEKEWLLVLDKEKQEKNVLVEQLKSVEYEIQSKDVKLNSLKKDLDSLQEKLAEASSAVMCSSDQLSAKESEAFSSRIQLEKMLASVQEKNDENISLHRAINAVKQDLNELLQSNVSTDSSLLESSDIEVYLQHLIKQIHKCHHDEVGALKRELQKNVSEFQSIKTETENSHSQAMLLAQQNLEILETRLVDEENKNKESAEKYSSSQFDAKTKEDQINCMNVQISQQKELLTGLTQQLRDKDTSVSQLLQSAASERVRLCEENSSLKEQLEIKEQVHHAAVMQLEEQMYTIRGDIQMNTSEKVKLSHEIDGLKASLEAVSKERDAIKKKLQAALVLRKELLKKIQDHEKVKEESLKNRSEVLNLQEKIECITGETKCSMKMLEDKLLLLEKELGEKEAALHEQRTKSDSFEQINEDKSNLQVLLDEKKERLLEKTTLVHQLQTTLAEKQESYDHEKLIMMQTIESLQKEITDLKEVESSVPVSLELENELLKLKQEKAMLQKKAQAALLARKETMKKAQEQQKKLSKDVEELKDDNQKHLEKQSKLTNNLATLESDLDTKTKELKEVSEISSSYLEELGSLRKLLEEKDADLEHLKVLLEDRDDQCVALANMQTSLEILRSDYESLSSKLAEKEESLSAAEQYREELKAKIRQAEEKLEKAQEDLVEKNHELNKYQEKVLELRSQQEKNDLEASTCNLERLLAIEELNQKLLMENKTLLEESNIHQKMLADTKQQLIDGEKGFAEDLKKALQDCNGAQKNIESLTKENEIASIVIEDLRALVTKLNNQITQHEEMPLTKQENIPLAFKCAEDLEEKFRERDDALLVAQSKVSEKDKLISALERQLQQQIQSQEFAVNQMKTEVEELRKSQEDDIKRDNQSKMNQLTKKLQAALVSRKELIKENTSIKEGMKTLSTQYEAKESQYLTLETSHMGLKKNNDDLENTILSQMKDKEKLVADFDRVRNDNHSLSSACEDLKQTIESITQQKEALSRQLESLKELLTEELNQWKTKHAELKQDYESLLQDNKKVSGEMDKMHQLLVEAKQGQQEAQNILYQRDIEMDKLRSGAKEVESENAHIKEKMHNVLKEKRQKIEAMEEENERMKKELTDIDATTRMTMAELTSTNQNLMDKACALQKSTEDQVQELREITAENQHLKEQLEEASSSLENKRVEEESYTAQIQQKLDKALHLNNLLTSQLQSLKTEMGAQVEINNLLQKENQSISEVIESLRNDHELELQSKEDALKELQQIINRHSQEAISLNEKVRILEDDKSLLQEELENIQEISDKVKNENEYLETVNLKNSELIDELTETVKALQTQNTDVASQLVASKDMNNQVCKEKDKEQLKLVREFEGKLRNIQRGNEGSKNVKKELQELLKEKHREINQLQKNCIKYQEVILDLESSLKTSQSICEQLEREDKNKSEKISTLENRHSQDNIELASINKLLQEANEKVKSVQLEKDQLTLEMSLCRKRYEEMESQESKDVSYLKENQNTLQQQVRDLMDLKERESQKVNELQQQIDYRDLQINTLKRTLETNEVKLAALSSTPQGADAAKFWNDKCQKALLEKDNQLLEQGSVIKKFLEDTRSKEKEMHELYVTKSRLERSLNEYSVAAAAQQRQLFIMSATNSELGEKVELLTLQLNGLRAQSELVEQGRNKLNRQLMDNEDVISQLKLRLQQLEKIHAETDAERELLQNQSVKLKSDYEKQQGIALQLKSLLNGKDAEISSLLSCKDGHMSEYLEQLKENYQSQTVVFEKRIAELQDARQTSDRDVGIMEARFRSITVNLNRVVQEKELMAEKVESLKNSVTTLQGEREQLASENRALRAEIQLVLKEKDGFAEGQGTKGFKHEIRKMLHQMDDLNSENAMLRAQLVRYREDLNQVLSLKDNQVKILLKKQQDTIKNLENQKASVERQQRDSQEELKKKEEVSNVFKSEISNLKSQVSQLEAAVLDHKATDAGKVICDLQQAVTAKASECNDLLQKVQSQKMHSDELNDQLKLLRTETDKQLVTAEDKYNSELDSFEQEVELMRNQQEAADQRVADLTKDLLEMEQQLSDARKSEKSTSVQNESLCKAMSALQDDRDKLIEDFKILRSRYDEELQDSRMAFNKTERSLQDAISDMAMISKERTILADRLKAFESKDTHRELNKLLGELTKTVSEKEKQLKMATSENTTCSRQLSAFSKSMVSLQNDRDRLVDELAEARLKQGSSLEATLSSSMGKSTGYGPSGFRIEKRGPVINEVEAPRLQSSFDVSNQKKELSFENEAQLVKETVVLAGQSSQDESAVQLEAERLKLHRDLQRCFYEIQQRDQYLQQLNMKLQQATEEKGEVASQLRAVSQTLRDTQNRCHWLENHIQIPQGSAHTEVAPGAPQERSNHSITDTSEADGLRERLLDAEQRLADETCRRETAEEALRSAEDAAKRVLAREAPRTDVSIDMDAEDEWDAVSLDPNQPLLSRKVKGGMMVCRQWLRGRSLYFSRLLTSRARSRYFFLAYLLTLHVLVLMCISGAL